MPFPTGMAEPRVRSRGFPGNRGWTGSARRPGGWQRDAGAVRCRVSSGIIPPTRSNNKKAHLDLPEVPEIARVRCQCLTLQFGSGRVGSISTCGSTIRLTIWNGPHATRRVVLRQQFFQEGASGRRARVRRYQLAEGRRGYARSHGIACGYEQCSSGVQDTQAQYA